MEKKEYKKIINDYIETEYFDIVFELTATDTATIDTVAEQLTDDIAAIIDIETDEDRDALVTAIYETLRNDHADEIQRGEKIQALTLAIFNNPEAFTEFNNNIWTLSEYLEEATPETLATLEKKYITNNL